MSVILICNDYEDMEIYLGQENGMVLPLPVASQRAMDFLFVDSMFFQIAKGVGDTKSKCRM